MRRSLHTRALFGATTLACLCAAIDIQPRTAEAVCSPDQLFAPPVLTSTGPNPRREAAGDFNEDGILDLAIAVSAASSRVEIRLGLGAGGVGNGSFGPGIQVPVGPTCFAVVTGDFNEDSRIDLAVVTNVPSGNVAILLGRGSLGGNLFEAPQYFPAGPSPHNLVAGKFDDDDHLDVAVANNGAATVSVLLGNGDGTLGAATTFPIHQTSTGIATGDFNEDGFVDLVATANFAGEVAVLLGTGGAGDSLGSPCDSTFRAAGDTLGPPCDSLFRAAVHYSAGVEPYDIAVGDFDDDGISDLAVANTASGGVRVLRGNGAGGVGNGTFGSPLTYAGGANAASIAVLEANNDGIDDLAFAASNPARVGILLGNGTGGQGDGSFAAGPSFTVGSNPAGVIVADFNEDGVSDLACVGYAAGNFAVLLGACTRAEPILTDVRDVRNDEGGRVFLTWLGSGFDAPPHQVITGYRVWRRIHPAKTAAAPSEVLARRTVSPDGVEDVTYWEALVTLPAQYLPGYGYTAPTTQDSLGGSNPYTAFFVTALTANPFVFYESNVDSGYSVDNLAPAAPDSFAGAPHPSGGIALVWVANDEADLMAYRLYRGSAVDFVPGPANLVATVTATGYLDAKGSVGQVYKLAAVDAHGNASGFAVASPVATTDVGEPGVAFALERPYPQPSRGERMTIAFSLPGAGPASLEVIDLAGRRIIRRDLGSLGAGRHTVDLASHELSPGIYWLRLTHGVRSLTSKFARVE